MTTTAISSQSSTFSVNTATAGAKTISGAAIGNGTILTATAHGLALGDVVVIAAIVGTLASMNGMTFVVVNETVNSFEVDYDSTGLVYTSGGTATPQAWTPIANVKSFTGMDGSAADIDVSNLSSIAKEFQMGLQDEGQFSITLDLDAADAGQVALLAARTAQAKKQFKWVLPNAHTATFSGFVKKASADAGVDKVIGRMVDIRITGPVTWT